MDQAGYPRSPADRGSRFCEASFGERKRRECPQSPSSEAQPQTIAREGAGSSVNKEPAILSASLWRPLRVRGNLANGIITQKMALLLKT